MKNSPTLLEIANSFELWQEYADPSGLWSDEKFATAPVVEKIKLLTDCGFSDSAAAE